VPIRKNAGACARAMLPKPSTATALRSHRREIVFLIVFPFCVNVPEVPFSGQVK
jgi:hypothetical protein